MHKMWKSILLQQFSQLVSEAPEASIPWLLLSFLTIRIQSNDYSKEFALVMTTAKGSQFTQPSGISCK